MPGCNLSGPPRNVPFLVALRLLFGGGLNQLGWLFGGVGMIFFWMFTLNGDYSSFRYFRGELGTAQGIVREVRKTSFSVGGSKHSKGTPVYEYRYSFTAPEGGQYTGVSYSTGQVYNVGARAIIEYPKGNPSISRIRGLRRSVFGPNVAFVVIFPLLGFAMVAAGLRRGFRAMRLLVHGKVSQGKLVSKVATNARVNNQPVYKLTFEFQADDGFSYQTVVRTHACRVLEDEPQEPLVYDPVDPTNAVLLDSLPGGPRVDASGALRVANPILGLLSLLLPAICIVGHGTYACVRFMRW